MATGINISIASETRQFAQGVQRGVIEPLEGAAESLDALATEARQAGDGIERGLEQGAEGAQREVDSATERMERSFQDLAAVSKREAKQGSDTLAREYKQAGQKAERAIDGVGDEAKGTAREMAASFSGSSSDILGGIQEVAANAGAVYGPAGLLAGAAAAIGLGTLTAEMERQQEEAAELKQALIDAYKSAAEEGRTFLNEAQINAAALELFLDPGKMDRFRKEAESIGVDINTYVRGQAGDYGALEYAIGQATAAEEKRLDATAETNAQLDAGADVQVIQLGKIRGKLEELAGQHETNQKAAAGYNDYMSQVSADERARIQRTRDASTARYEALAGQLDRTAEKVRNLPNGRIRVDVVAEDPASFRAHYQRQLDRLGALRINADVVGTGYGRRPV